MSTEDQSPRAAAEDAKARRDLAGELGALIGADRRLGAGARRLTEPRAAV